MANKNLTHRQMADFCQSLYLLTQAGIGLSDGLSLMSVEETEYSAAVLEQMCRELDSGRSLSAAMSAAGAFPFYAVSMVQVGERTGHLEGTLLSLAEYYKDRCRVSSMVRSALLYPAMIMVLMLVVIVVLLVKVLPIFNEVYASLGTQLSGVGAGLLHLGQLLKTGLPVLLALVAAVVVGLLLYTLCRPLRTGVQALLQKKMGDKGIARLFNNAQFARVLSLGISSGLPLEEAFDLAQMVFANLPEADHRCKQCGRLLEEGTPLAEAMVATGFLSGADGRMLTVGTRGGNADRVMKEIADRMMNDAGQALENRVARVEPTLVLVSSLLVGAILLSVMLPLANIMSTIG